MTSALEVRPLLVGQGLRKDYGPVQALQSIDIVINEGEIVGLAGDNGAGKSTLMKIVAGATRPTAGTLTVASREIEDYSPEAALAAGIAIVYQELALCDNLDVRENVYLGRELLHRRWLGLPILDYDSMTVGAEALLARLGVRVDSLFDPVAELSGGQRQAVAMCRALAFQPRLMLLDEPTAALSANAVKPLLTVIRRLPEEGCAVLIVSHRLTDLFETADRIYVLRHGEVVANLTTHETNEEELLRLMAGSSSN